MEEKKSINISLSTFLLIIAIIVIIIMGILMCKFYKDKTKEIEKNLNLQNEVNRLSGTVSDLQSKIDSVEEILTKDDTETNQSNNEYFSDEQVRETLSNYLELEASANCDALLENLTEKGKLKYDSSKDNMLNDGTIITNIKFSDYKNAMLNYISESEFEKNWTTALYYDKDNNGYLTKIEGGGGLRVYTIKSITKTADSSYNAKVTSVVEDGEYFEENNFDFIVTSYNGNCVIDSIK